MTIISYLTRSYGLLISGTTVVILNIILSVCSHHVTYPMNTRMIRVCAFVSSPPPWLNHPYTALRALTFPIRLGLQILDTPTSRLIIFYRNNFLTERVPLPKATSTGTTIVGCLFKDGIVLGADTRATEGDIVADKNCEKVQPLLLYHWCTDHGPPDPLHHGIHSLLWCRNSRGHRIYYRPHLFKHGAP
jgi:hypothetical protein